MNFYMPCTECDEQAEMIWSGLRQRLAGLGLPTTRRRIAAVSPDDRPDLRFEVGQSHLHSGEIILLILETSGLGFYWVFTQNRRPARASPIWSSRRRHRLRGDGGRAALGGLSEVSRA